MGGWTGGAPLHARDCTNGVGGKGKGRGKAWLVRREGRGMACWNDILESADFSLVVKLVVQSALDVGIHGSRSLVVRAGAP